MFCLIFYSLSWTIKSENIVRIIACLCVCACNRWQAGGPGRCLRWTLWRACGLPGRSGLNALRPAGWVYHKGAGSVYLLHLPRSFPCPTLHPTGQVTCQAALEARSFHLDTPTIPLITPGNTSLITLLPFNLTATRDCHCTGIPTLGEEGLLYRDRAIHPVHFIRQNSPHPIKIMHQFIDLPIALLRVATTSKHGSLGGQPIREQ